MSSLKRLRLRIKSTIRERIDDVKKFSSSTLKLLKKRQIIMYYFQLNKKLLDHLYITDILYHDCKQLKNVVISREIKEDLAESYLVYDQN